MMPDDFSRRNSQSATGTWQKGLRVPQHRNAVRILEKLRGAASLHSAALSENFTPLTPASRALLQSVLELPLALLFQQVIELLGFRVRLLFQDCLVGL
jgi:hypothetical protein